MTDDRRLPVLGVILAGGANRRYANRPKALEPVGGERIIDRVIRALDKTVEQVVLVANDAELFGGLGLETRPDVVPGLGALGGIYTAVLWAAEVGCRGALVVACDMPFLSSRLLATLADGAAPDEVVAPESESRRGLEPLHAFYGSGCRTAIERALARGDRHVISFFDDVRVRTIPHATVSAFGNPDILFMNVNTPEDRERADLIVRETETRR